MSLRRRNSLSRGQGKFNRNEHLDIKACFEIYDTESAGKLSSDDTAKCMRALGNMLTQQQCEDIVTELDMDHDGECGYDAFLELLEKFSTPALKRRDLEDAFRALDDDASGAISSKELKHVLQAIGEPLTDDEVKEFMKAADKDGDGEVNYDEFASMMIAPTRRRMSLFGDPRKAGTRA